MTGLVSDVVDEFFEAIISAFGKVTGFRLYEDTTNASKEEKYVRNLIGYITSITCLIDGS